MGRSKREILWGFLTLLNEYCLRPEVFIDKKKLRDCVAKISYERLSFFAEKSNESNTHVEMKLIIFGKWKKKPVSNTDLTPSYFQMQKLPIFMLIPLPYVVMLHVYVNLKYST